MFSRYILFLFALACAMFFSGCYRLPKDTRGVAVSVTKQKVIGRWGSIVTDPGFGSRVLVVAFDKRGRYSFTWVGPLPSVSQESGSQPASGEVEEGYYRIRNNMLYLDRAGDRRPQR